MLEVSHRRKIAMNPSRRRVLYRALLSLSLIAVMGGIGAPSLSGQTSIPVRDASLANTAINERLERARYQTLRRERFIATFLLCETSSILWFLASTCKHWFT